MTNLHIDLTMKLDVSFIVNSQKSNLIDPDWDEFPCKLTMQSNAGLRHEIHNTRCQMQNVKKMKMRFFLLGVLLMTLTMTQARTPVKVRASDGFIYFKVSKQMCGGTIEVRDSTGEVIRVRKIDHRHLYVDLFENADGKYNVKIWSGDTVLEFTCTLASREIHARQKHHDSHGTSELFIDDRVIRIV
jgi:hypothetical protein